VDCELDGQACRAQVDTRSNITLVRLGVLPPRGCSPQHGPQCTPTPCQGGLCVSGQGLIRCTDPASLSWLSSYRNPEGQVARRLEALEEYNFEVLHRLGGQHGNADAPSRHPCAAI